MRRRDARVGRILANVGRLAGRFDARRPLTLQPLGESVAAQIGSVYERGLRAPKLQLWAVA